VCVCAVGCLRASGTARRRSWTRHWRSCRAAEVRPSRRFTEFAFYRARCRRCAVLYREYTLRGISSFCMVFFRWCVWAVVSVQSWTVSVRCRSSLGRCQSSLLDGVSTSRPRRWRLDWHCVGRGPVSDAVLDASCVGRGHVREGGEGALRPCRPMEMETRSFRSPQRSSPAHDTLARAREP
jgi:hypothetical protein